MDENNQKPTVECKPEESAPSVNEDAVSSVVKVDENEPSSIDFSGIDTLANTTFEKERWYVSLGNSILESLLSLGLFLLSILLDVFKALWQVIQGFFVGIYKIVLGIGHYFRKLNRMWREGDGSVKASFFFSGLGNFRRGQIVDGCVFLGVEIAFVLFMFFGGITNIYNFIFLGEASRGLDPSVNPLPFYASIQGLILGLITIVLICLYFFVWNAGVRSAYDAYVITENYRFLTAKEDALYYVRHLEEFKTTFEMVEVPCKDGKTRSEIRFLSPGKLYREMRNVYGYSRLSALYISYIRPNRLNVKPDNGLKLKLHLCHEAIYAKYKKMCAVLLKGKWSGIFAKYLVWEMKKPAPVRGFVPVENELIAQINAHRHTYDKYNRYNPIVRDATNLLEVLDNPTLLDQAIFAEDPASKSNNVAPIDRNNEKLKAKVVASRVVGAFECSYEAALSASKIYLICRKRALKEGKDTLELLAETTARRHDKLDQFVETYDRIATASRLGMKEAYLSYASLRADFDQGKNVFVSCCMSDHKMTKDDAIRVYEDYAYAIRVCKDDEARIQDLLGRFAGHLDSLEENYKISPLYGEPIRFKKKSKQYLDEKFAVTVLSLPVLGASIFSVLPLLFSIVIAFTNYNKTGTVDNVSRGVFDWSWDSIIKFFGMGSDSFGSAFGSVLLWTLTWAFFATFLNYIFGIVLALLINNKHIKLKKMWRTFFVISIAVPQFITLLVMRKMFADNGPVATWLYNDMHWIDSPVLFWLANPANNAFLPKLMLIVINCWIGIPYTMLSTTGILMNIPEDLYESARIDGASPWKQFWKITMPYILFVTGPSLLTTFIGNINNFNVIYFLTGGGPSNSAFASLGAEAPQYTDLLITWLYRMTVNATNPKYGIGSVIGIMIFVICAFFSLIAYKRLGSTQNEEAFQ